jgi:hypothetical protein
MRRSDLLRIFCLPAAFAVTAGVSTARAQYWGGGYAPPYYGSYGGGTVEGSIAHGYADLVRSAGAYNLMTSEAYKNYEDARKKNIENRLQWTQTYFEMRRINDEYRRAQYERDKRTQEDFIRYAQAAAPHRLVSSQLDPITGYLAWPRLLMTPAFADSRRELDRLFAARAGNKGAIGNDAYFAILDQVDRMQEQLRRLIKVAPANDYIEARKFLESLAYEARFAAN